MALEELSSEKSVFLPVVRYGQLIGVHKLRPEEECFSSNSLSTLLLASWIHTPVVVVASAPE